MSAEVRRDGLSGGDPRLARDALEGRLAQRLASALAESAEAVPHDIGERLRVARQLALTRGRVARHEAQATQAGATIGLGGSPGTGAALGLQRFALWRRFAASLMPIFVLLLGFAAVDRLAEHEQAAAAADIDASLLADELPPAAYADPGFVEFLRSPPP